MVPSGRAAEIPHRFLQVGFSWSPLRQELGLEVGMVEDDESFVWVWSQPVQGIGHRLIEGGTWSWSLSLHPDVFTSVGREISADQNQVSLVGNSPNLERSRGFTRARMAPDVLSESGQGWEPIKAPGANTIQLTWSSRCHPKIRVNVGCVGEYGEHATASDDALIAMDDVHADLPATSNGVMAQIVNDDENQIGSPDRHLRVAHVGRGRLNPPSKVIFQRRRLAAHGYEHGTVLLSGKEKLPL